MRRELLGYLVAALAMGGTKCVYDHGQRQAGVWQERARVAEANSKAMARIIRMTDTVYLRDTVRLTRRVQSWDTVTQVVAALPDTVRVPVETVRWIVAEADSTITACRSVVITCEQRVAQRDSLNALLSQRLTIEQARRPSRFGKWAAFAAGAGVMWLARQ